MATSGPSNLEQGGKSRVRKVTSHPEQAEATQPVVAREEDAPVVSEQDMGFEERFGFPSRWE